MRLLSSFIAIALFSLSAAAQAQSANPLEGNARAVYAGGVLFRAQCATCHGADAKGISTIDAPDLTLMWSQRQLSVQDVFNTIREGIPGSIMPPHDFTDTETWMLVGYLQSVAAEGVSELPEGDAANGGRLFTRHCSECHRAAGEGGSLGPNLTSITSQRTLESLRTSVRQPSALIQRGYKPITVVTSDNETVQGVLKSEDAFSLQLMDQNQRLRAFMKSNLRRMERSEISLMPAFPPSLIGEQDLLDIFNYLDEQ